MEWLPLEELIEKCESMTDLEKDLFLSLARHMTEKQLSDLRNILEREREEIRKIESRFPKESVTINTDLDAKERHLLEGKRIADSISKN